MPTWNLKKEKKRVIDRNSGWVDCVFDRFTRRTTSVGEQNQIATWNPHSSLAQKWLAYAVTYYTTSTYNTSYILRVEHTAYEYTNSVQQVYRPYIVNLYNWCGVACAAIPDLKNVLAVWSKELNKLYFMNVSKGFYSNKNDDV